MRNNKRQLVVWLTDEEREMLGSNIAATSTPDGRPMSVSAYVRMLIRQDERRTPTQE